MELLPELQSRLVRGVEIPHHWSAMVSFITCLSLLRNISEHGCHLCQNLASVVFMAIINFGSHTVCDQLHIVSLSMVNIFAMTPVKNI